MPPRILIVDDDASCLELHTMVIESSLGAIVDTAQDNASGIALAVQNRPDLIITDIGHPGGSGVDLFFKLRSNPLTSAIPVLILSGSLSEEMELSLYRSGIDGAFRKPLQVVELIRRIIRILKLDSDPDIAVLTVGVETRDLDYKEYIDLSNKDARAALAKDVIAMANSGGGTIIIGVAETSPGRFDFCGLPPERLETFEPTKVADALQRYLGSAISVKTRKIEWRSKFFVLLKVPSSNGTLAMAHSDNESAGLFQGRIYIRTDAARSAEVRNSLEVMQLIDRLIEARIRSRSGQS